ncbi:hypothetical protein MMC12_003216 [Toensbergia leucococca]|nr:hypothetical protein [Toensbergia leucococca]
MSRQSPPMDPVIWSDSGWSTDDDSDGDGQSQSSQVPRPEDSQAFLTTLSASNLISEDDGSLPTDLDQDDRFVNTDLYISSLERMERTVVSSSALGLFTSWDSPRINETAFLKLSSYEPLIKGPEQQWKDFENLDSQAVTQCQALISNDSQASKTRAPNSSIHSTSNVQQSRLRGNAYLLFHILECRNLLVKVNQNIATMHNERYCTQAITLLVLDRNRHGVANLVEVKLERIFDLTMKVNSILISLIERCVNGQILSVDQPEKILSLDFLHTFLKELGLDIAYHGTPVGPVKFRIAATLIRNVAHLLDFAVISYAGAHLESFDRLCSKPSSTSIEHIFMDSMIQNHMGKRIGLQRRPLRCLGGFLRGSKPWIFSVEDIKFSETEELFLSTTMEAFSDIWGPVWKQIALIDGQDIIEKYNVGSGSITLCRPGTEFGPPKLPEEALCHWSDRVSMQENSPTFPPFIVQPARLLIGASTDSGLFTNSDCPRKLSENPSRGGDYRPLGLKTAGKYRESETIQVSLSGFGLSTAYMRQYKRRSGVTWKEEFVERWQMEPERRNPRVLESWGGVEISHCTRNARRRRLLDILKSDAALDLLREGLFVWASPECERGYLEALESDDPKAFSKLYEREREWRKDLGRAVAWCFSTLRDTGLSRQGDFLALSTHNGSSRAMARVLSSKVHTWVGLLADTNRVATMAVIIASCLEFHRKKGQRCSVTHETLDKYSVLETAIDIQQSASDINMEQVSGRSIDQISLGAMGKLKVLRSLRTGHLLTYWKPRLLPNFAADMRSRFGVKLDSQDQGTVTGQEHQEDLEVTCATVHVMIVSWRTNWTWTPFTPSDRRPCPPRYTSDMLQPYGEMLNNTSASTPSSSGVNCP